MSQDDAEPLNPPQSAITMTLVAVVMNITRVNTDDTTDNYGPQPLGSLTHKLLLLPFPSREEVKVCKCVCVCCEGREGRERGRHGGGGSKCDGMDS